ncbi:polysaccharide deacetylase family protein [Phytoactinopolyspora halophila]|nr:polysaccharide deacetylase family protein [Phytoactinopolyspora halophila]
MKLTGPALVGMVIVVVALAMANSGAASESSDDQPARIAGTLPDLSEWAADGVTLTFDDGPHPTYTPEILDVLEARDVRAVFCVLGELAHKHPELIRRIAADGHVLCNHSYSHDAHLPDRPRSRIEEEIGDTMDAIIEATPDASIRFFRQPEMHVKPELAAVAADYDLAPLDWTLDARDWNRPGVATITKRVRQNIEPGSIILLHDGGGDRSQTVTALPQILDDVEAAGYDIVIPRLRPDTT